MTKDKNNIRYKYEFIVTTQGPIYPPSEIVDKNGDFVVIGQIPCDDGIVWGGAIVDKETPIPPAGNVLSFKIKKYIMELSEEEQKNIVLYSLPLPLPCNNYPMLFSPEQRPQAFSDVRESIPLHKGYIADYRAIDGKREIKEITLHSWMKASGRLEICLDEHRSRAHFIIQCESLVPNSVYTVMSLREHDFDVLNPTRPGPLGIPNIMMTDSDGKGEYWAELKNPFPDEGDRRNRIINIIILYMSCRQSYGGAIGLYGLGGDIHAHLKLPYHLLDDIVTYNK